MKFSKKLLYSILVLATGVSSVYAWTGPTGNPPVTNASVPINVSATSQVKSGGLNVGSLGVDGGATIGTSLTVTGTASLKGVNFSVLYPTTGTSPNGGYSHYGIYEEPGVWDGTNIRGRPYPDLTIAYHTGISYVAYYGYGGHRFYTGYVADATPTTLTFSIGEGDGNVRVYTNLYVTGAITRGGYTVCDSSNNCGYASSSGLGAYLPLAGGVMNASTRIGINGSTITSGSGYGFGNGAAYSNMNSLAVDTLETDGGTGGGGTLELNYYGGNEVHIGSSGSKPLRASILQDGYTGFYVDPNSNSYLQALQVAGGSLLVNWPGYPKGLQQTNGNYIYPGFLTGQGSGWNTSYYLAGSTSWGLYSNTSLNAQGLYDSGNRVYSAANPPPAASGFLPLSGGTVTGILTVNGPSNDWAGKFVGSGQYGLYSANSSGYYSYNAYNIYGLYTNGYIYAGGTINSASLINATNYFQINGKYALDGTDSWLRLNQQGSFASGTYTPYNFRSDGGYYGGGTINLREPTNVAGDIAQVNGRAIYPGDVSNNYAYQKYWYLGSHASYGLYTNTGLYVSGTVYSNGSPVCQSNGGNCPSISYASSAGTLNGLQLNGPYGGWVAAGYYHLGSWGGNGWGPAVLVDRARYADSAGSAPASGGTADYVSTPSGTYKHLGAWGVGRTAAGAILVNTAYYADSSGYASSAGSASYATRAGSSAAETVYANWADYMTLDQAWDGYSTAYHLGNIYDLDNYTYSCELALAGNFMGVGTCEVGSYYNNSGNRYVGIIVHLNGYYGSWYSNSANYWGLWPIITRRAK